MRFGYGLVWRVDTSGLELESSGGRQGRASHDYCQVFAIYQQVSVKRQRCGGGRTDPAYGDLSSDRLWRRRIAFLRDPSKSNGRVSRDMQSDPTEWSLGLATGKVHLPEEIHVA